MKRRSERRAVSGPVEAVNSGAESTAKPSRRGFIKGAGAVAGLVLATSIKPSNGALDLGVSDAVAASGSSGAAARRSQSYKIRVSAAQAEMQIPPPPHPNNGDEVLYPNRIGNFSKGLPHDPTFGEVDPSAYNALLKA